ncbi:MAG: 23S rRNA (guanosine2251-2'-O)-methyltransferase [Urechidicola sp.]|jgi:23S rRNA (guanosine2251-2'-O)-methyltransferase
MSDLYIYGFHPIAKMLQHTPESCLAFICTESKNPRLISLIARVKELKLPIRVEPKDVLNSLVGSDKHQGCAMHYVASTSGTTSVEQCLAEMHNRSLFLVLDGVQDPHNLGACLRTANGAGVDAVIIPKDRSAKLNATVSKVAAGAAESTPLLEVTNISRCLKDLKNAGVWIYGTSGDAKGSLYDFDYQNPVALVMGAEGDGLRRLTMEQCDHLIKLPMHGSVESLNVSVATGVCLYEIMRSRMACS